MNEVEKYINSQRIEDIPTTVVVKYDSTDNGVEAIFDRLRRLEHRLQDKERIMITDIVIDDTLYSNQTLSLIDYMLFIEKYCKYTYVINEESEFVMSLYPLLNDSSSGRKFLFITELLFRDPAKPVKKGDDLISKKLRTVDTLDSMRRGSRLAYSFFTLLFSVPSMRNINKKQCVVFPLTNYIYELKLMMESICTNIWTSTDQFFVEIYNIFLSLNDDAHNIGKLQSNTILNNIPDNCSIIDIVRLLFIDGIKCHDLVACLSDISSVKDSMGHIGLQAFSSIPSEQVLDVVWYIVSHNESLDKFEDFMLHLIKIISFCANMFTFKDASSGTPFTMTMINDYLALKDHEEVKKLAHRFKYFCISFMAKKHMDPNTQSNLLYFSSDKFRSIKYGETIYGRDFKVYSGWNFVNMLEFIGDIVISLPQQFLHIVTIEDGIKLSDIVLPSQFIRSPSSAINYFNIDDHELFVYSILFDFKDNTFLVRCSMERDTIYNKEPKYYIYEIGTYEGELVKKIITRDTVYYNDILTLLAGNEELRSMTLLYVMRYGSKKTCKF